MPDLGDKVYTAALGVVVFQNRLKGLDVPQWDIDSYAARTAVQTLSAGSYEKVEVLRVPRQAAETSRSERINQIFAEASRQGFDTVVFLYQGSYPNFPFFVPGYGVFQYVHHNDVLGEKCIYAAYSVSVSRVSSREQLGWEWGSRGPCFGISTPTTLAAKVRMEDYSESELQSVRDGVEQQIEKSLPSVLKALKLVR